jgi:hypothetical protein
MKVRLLLLFLLITLLATAGTAVAAGKSRNFRAHLSGKDAGVETLAQGQAVFQFSKDGEQLRYKLAVANIENVTMAHIHLAEDVGGNGPPVVWLYPDGPPPQEIPGRFDGVLAKGTVTANDLVGPLAGKTLEDLKEAMEQGLTYVNVHTSQNPGGEIRGDIQ